MSLNLRRFDLYELRAVTSWLQKSSVAELPLNLTWNIYAFSGFLRRTSGQALQAQRTRLQDDSAF